MRGKTAKLIRKAAYYSRQSERDLKKAYQAIPWNERAKAKADMKRAVLMGEGKKERRSVQRDERHLQELIQ